MGLFSDKDVNDLGKLLEEEPYRIEFIKNFEKGYKYVMARSKYIDDTGDPIPSSAQMSVIHDYYSHLSSGNAYFCQPGRRDPRGYGYYFGFLIGLLKYDPIRVLNLSPETLLNAFTGLKNNNQKLYKFVNTRLKRWKGVIKVRLESLTEKQRRNYTIIHAY